MASKELVVPYKIPAKWEHEVTEHLRNVEFYARNKRRDKLPGFIRQAMLDAAGIELEWLVWEQEQHIVKHQQEDGTTVLMPAVQTDDTITQEPVD